MRALAACVLVLAFARVSGAQELYDRAAHPDAAVRAAAARELAADPSLRAGELLVILLSRDASEAVRVAAAQAIAVRADENFASLLDSVAESDPSPAVRDAAKLANETLWPLSRRPRRAASLSLLCPGCGHFYLREPGEAAAYLLTTAALAGTGIALLSNNDGIPGLTGGQNGDLEPEDRLALPLILGAQNEWFYSIFDAYRDARLLRHDRGYHYPITDESLTDLASAPFRPAALSSPWVWGGVPVALALGFGLSALVEPESFRGGRPTIFKVREINFLGRQYSRGSGFALGQAYYGSLFLPVGVGEEALFRGFVQSELTEVYGPWPGLIAASVLFGALHTFNFLQPGQDARAALIAVPFITAVGGTLGLAYMKTDYRLETSVAMHFWYDFLLSTASFISDPAHQPFVVQVGSPF